MRTCRWLQRWAACATLVVGSILQAQAAVISTGPPGILVPPGLVDPLSSLAAGLPPGYFLVPVGFTAAAGLDSWTFDLAFDPTVAAPADLGGLYQGAYQAQSGGTVSQIVSSGFVLPGLLDDVSGFFEQPQDGSNLLAFLLFAYSPGQEGADPGVRVVDGTPPNGAPEPGSLLLAMLALGVLVARPLQRRHRRLPTAPERTTA